MMKNIEKSDDEFLDLGKGYEAYLFDYVLQHIKKDEKLDPEINEAISIALLQEDYFKKYYLKIKDLDQQGLFDDSNTYAYFLMQQEDLAEKGPDLASEETEAPPQAKSRQLFNEQPWANIAAAASILLLAAVLTFQFLERTGSNDNYLADNTTEDVENTVTTLGSETKGGNYFAYSADTDIKHNSELMTNYSDPVFCKMHLVFKGISDKGFIVRSKRRGIGKEDPFNEELEVRFSNSEKRAEIEKILETSLKNREFPEYIVKGLYCKDIEGLNTFKGLPLLTAIELTPVSE